MSNTRNALAELAVRLGTDALSLGADKYPEIAKAARIIAELAKVSDGEWVEYIGGNFYVCKNESRMVETAIGTCIEIAEEGAGDGK